MAVFAQRGAHENHIIDAVGLMLFKIVREIFLRRFLQLIQISGEPLVEHRKAGFKLITFAGHRAGLGVQGLPVPGHGLGHARP